jgi:hypothetical protein
MQRRQLLQIAAGLPLGSCMLAHAKLEAPHVTVHEVLDDAAAPLLHKGDLVMVDTAVTRYQGEGMYLYPAWGKPRAYQLDMLGERLMFSVPGQSQVMWQQDMTSDESLLAGRVIGVSRPQDLAGSGLVWSSLQVPALPAQG